jgi:hypothetical protein
MGGNMDNGRYIQYLYENPIVNTFVTTYEHITMFPEQLTNEEIVVIGTFAFLSLYALIKIWIKYTKKEE